MPDHDNPIDPKAPLSVPLTAAQAADYLAKLSEQDRNILKDYMRDQHDPSHFIDVAALEAALDSGILTGRSNNVAVNGSQWQLKMSAGQISQSEWSSIDLMYAASMKAERALKPLLYIQYPGGLGFLDGSHRIARAMIDGREVLPAVFVSYDDIGPYRVPESEIDALRAKQNSRGGYGDGQMGKPN